MATWYWKSDLRKKGGDESCWEPYSEEDNKRLEKAFNKGQKTMKFDEKYKIDFNDMLQYRILDKDRQRPIKREEPEEEAKPKKKKKKASSEDSPKPAKKAKK